MVADPPKRVYWDSCAWIGYINRESNKEAALQEVWLECQDGLIEIWTSTYSYIEVVYGINAHGEPYPKEQNDAIVYALLESANVERVQMDVEIAKLARDLKRQHHPTLGKRPDAVHLATALYWNCDEFHTWDGSDLLPLSERVYRKDGKPLKIFAPQPRPAKRVNAEFEFLGPVRKPPANEPSPPSSDKGGPTDQGGENNSSV